MRHLEIIAHEAESLPIERQAEVLDFIAFLKMRQSSQEPSNSKNTPPRIKRAEIEALAGALADDPIVRPSQGVLEVRESLT
ncbi:MAG: hypothetical protein WCK42_02920 [Myxococcaceae bacterium]